jgi:hypothetical protein
MADAQSTDGTLIGMSTFTIDRKTGVKGIGDAIKSVGWLTETSDGLIIARFDEHNGASAKRRSLEAKRKGETRKPSASCPHPMQTETGHDAELDKIRIDKNIYKEKEKVADAPVVSDFERFWSAYPKKVGKANALKEWKKASPEIESVLQSLSRQKAWRENPAEGEFIPAWKDPERWIKAGCWNDEVTVPEEQDEWASFPRS